nr:ABC transporter ATP-binding protein [Ilumatobacter sp.]
GGTVVFSSHVMDLVERLCDHVAVIHQGRVVASGPTERLRNGRRLEEAFIDVVGASEVDHDALAWLA